MRLRLATAPGALFGAMLLAALVVFLPLRLALGWAGLADYGFSAERVTGTVWGGTVRGVQVGRLSLGTVHAELSPLALLAGRARVAVSAGDALHGAVGSSRHGFFLDDATADLPAGTAFAPLPVTRLGLDAVKIHFTDGRCDVATGRVRATLGGAVAGVALPPSVAGPIRCDGEAVLLPLVSATGGEGIAMRLTGSGRYRAELRIASGDPAAVTKLQAAGFAPGADGYRLAVEGSL